MAHQCLKKREKKQGGESRDDRVNEQTLTYRKLTMGERGLSTATAGDNVRSKMRVRSGEMGKCCGRGSKRRVPRWIGGQQEGWRAGKTQRERGREGEGKGMGRGYLAIGEGKRDDRWGGCRQKKWVG
eukprot:3807399-Pleurochrysis_carterae.AAC.3